MNSDVGDEGKCGLCAEVSSIAGTAAACILPLTGDTVAQKLEKWRVSRAPPELRDSKIQADMLVCHTCLECLVHVEEVEMAMIEGFESLWNRFIALKPDNNPSDDLLDDILQTATYAAGIEEDFIFPPEVDKVELVEELSKSASFEIPKSVPKKISSSALVQNIGKICIRRVSAEPSSEEKKPDFCDDEDSWPDPSTAERSIKIRTPSKSSWLVRKARHAGPKEVTQMVCPICGKLMKYSSEQSMRKHIEVVHKKLRTMKCQFCDETFTYHEQLYVHEARVHNHQLDRIIKTCPYCGKTTLTRWGMKQHLFSKHGQLPDKGKVHECADCGKKFLALQHFKDHMNMHLGLRPWACPLCDVRMVKFENIRQHAHRVHNVRVRIKQEGGAEVVIESNVQPKLEG